MKGKKTNTNLNFIQQPYVSNIAIPILFFIYICICVYIFIYMDKANLSNYVNIIKN